jgi:hypothetical protein
LNPNNHATQPYEDHHRTGKRVEYRNLSSMGSYNMKAVLQIKPLTSREDRKLEMKSIHASNLGKDE